MLKHTMLGMCSISESLQCKLTRSYSCSPFPQGTLIQADRVQVKLPNGDVQWVSREGKSDDENSLAAHWERYELYKARMKEIEKEYEGYGI